MAGTMKVTVPNGGCRLAHDLAAEAIKIKKTSNLILKPSKRLKVAISLY